MFIAQFYVHGHFSVVTILVFVEFIFRITNRSCTEQLSIDIFLTDSISIRHLQIADC